uniref:Thyroglobulin type-1 domain-containing protein n=1 Tax=Globodera pallida TaxID=36090 RepID=A0A183BYD4_GLOPA
MKAKAIALAVLSAIFVPLNPAIAGPLKCQRGRAISFEGTDQSGISDCPIPTEQYCVEVTCTAWDQPGNIVKHWDCVVSQEEGCRVYELAMEERTKSKNVSCHCRFGEKGKNVTNVPSSAAENRLRCKAGTVDATGAGETYDDNDCIDGYEYCYEAYCAKAKWNEHVQTTWGCSKDTSSSNSCDALGVAVSAQTNSAVKCECTFGKKGVQYGNKDFPVSPTTSQKPTTSTSTTTTTKMTTTTTTTTTEKPTTTMTTFKVPKSITGKPMTTTADVGKFFNLSVPCEFLYGKKDTDLSNTDLIKTTTTTTEKPTISTTTTTTTPEKTSTMTTPDTNVFGEGRKTGLLCVLDKICTILEKNGTAKPSRRFAPHLVKESGKCKNLGYEVKAGKDQVEKLGNELSESIQKVGLVFVDDYILAIE